MKFAIYRLCQVEDTLTICLSNFLSLLLHNEKSYLNDYYSQIYPYKVEGSDLTQCILYEFSGFDTLQGIAYVQKAISTQKV